MFENDYVMRMISDMVRAIAKVLFKKETAQYEFENENDYTANDMLYLKLDGMIRSGKINEAENILMENMDLDDIKYRELAVDFYWKINDFNDEYLEEHNYSRDEIKDGLKNVSGNIPI